MDNALAKKKRVMTHSLSFPFSFIIVLIYHILTSPLVTRGWTIIQSAY